MVDAAACPGGLSVKIAIMQPYFFPYPGQFRLMAAVDRWVVFDTAQYLRRGWMHRNRVLHPDGGWRYIRVPVNKAPRNTAVRDIGVREDADWREALLGRLQPYGPHAPHFQATMDLVAHCLDQSSTSLAQLNTVILERLSHTLGIPFEPLYLSETDYDPGPGAGPQQRIIEIARALGATRYCNAPGGRDLYEKADFARAGLQLEFMDELSLRYDTGPFAFEPGLSIIDALMWCTPETLRAAL